MDTSSSNQRDGAARLVQEREKERLERNACQNLLGQSEGLDVPPFKHEEMPKQDKSKGHLTLDDVIREAGREFESELEKMRKQYKSRDKSKGRLTLDDVREARRKFESEVPERFRKKDLSHLRSLRTMRRSLQSGRPMDFHVAFERFRGELGGEEATRAAGRRVQCMAKHLRGFLEGKFQVAPQMKPELQMVAEKDQVTHRIDFLTNDAELPDDDLLEELEYNPNYFEDRKRYLLGEDSYKV